MWDCPLCGKSYPDSSNFCSNCGIHQPVYKPNYCTNPNCINHTVKLDDPELKYCEKCHKLTTFGKTIEDLL